MLHKLGELVRGEIAALKDELATLRGQIREIAAWLGISPFDAGLGIATLSGVLAFVF